MEPSKKRESVTFEVGSGQIIPGLDSEIRGMSVGDKRTVVLDANHPLAGKTLTFAIELVTISE